MKPPKVLNHHGYCLLRFTVQGVRYSLTLGRYDDPQAHRRASRAAFQIAEDVETGVFDGNLDAYKDNATGITKAKIIAFMEQGLEVTGKPIYQGILKHLREYAHEIRNTPEAERFILSLNVSTASKRRYYTALRSFKGLKEIFDFPIVRPKDELIKDIDPFTEDEVKAILEALRHSLYYPYFAFLAYTGCRPSEALALTWADLTLNGISGQATARITKALDSSGIVKTTKTGKSRTVPIPDVLLGILVENRKDAPSLGWVFSNRPSKTVIRHNWAMALRKAQVRYRPLYNLRHSFITHCLVKGVSVATVAKWCGNSPEVIYKHYAGSLDTEAMPSLY